MDGKKDKKDGDTADVGDQSTTERARASDVKPSGVAVGKAGAGEKAETLGPPVFNLARDPWLPVQRVEDGVVVELSLRDVLTRAGRLRRIVGDIPTQELALLRMVLAVLYDAYGGPEDLDAWADLWDAEDPFAKGVEYLDRYADRFELLDAERPFFQTSGLRTERDEVAPLSRIVADVPTGSALFSMRHPGVERLSFAEAARWLVHAHAFDVSGIKPAMRKDSRGKAGKVYPLGVGSLGMLGGVFAEGDSLRETLLLNLLPFEHAYQGSGHADSLDLDVPAWRRQEPYGPGPRGKEGSGPEPVGLRDLYTWQTRRIRLVAAGDAVTGVVLGYGDPLVQESPWLLEPMTAWRRSPAQEKKRKRPLYYTPLRHDSRRAAWRGLEALLPARSSAADSGRRGDPADRLPPRITQWLADVSTECEFPPGKLMRLRTVGVEYGTQQSVIDEVVDDSVVLPVVTLHSGNPVYWGAAVEAVHEADEAVKALGRLAANLTLAAGGEHPEAADETARDLGYGLLDGPYRGWLRELARQTDLAQARQRWRETVRRQVRRLARQEIRSAGPAALEGRMVVLPRSGETLVDAGRAELWFGARLDKVLGPPPSRRPGQESDDSS